MIIFATKYYKDDFAQNTNIDIGLSTENEIF